MAAEPLNLQELGLKGFLAGTSPEAAELIDKQIQIALKDSKIIEQYDQIGITIIGAGPQEKVKFLAADIAHWREVIKNANIQQQPKSSTKNHRTKTIFTFKNCTINFFTIKRKIKCL